MGVRAKRCKNRGFAAEKVKCIRVSTGCGKKLVDIILFLAKKMKNSVLHKTACQMQDAVQNLSNAWFLVNAHSGMGVQ